MGKELSEFVYHYRSIYFISGYTYKINMWTHIWADKHETIVNVQIPQFCTDYKVMLTTNFFISGRNITRCWLWQLILTFFTISSFKGYLLMYRHNKSRRLCWTFSMFTTHCGLQNIGNKSSQPCRGISEAAECELTSYSSLLTGKTSNNICGVRACTFSKHASNFTNMTYKDWVLKNSEDYFSVNIFISV